MRALVVYCHPRAESFTAAVRDVVLGKLEAAGVEVHVSDLYAQGFDCVMSAENHRDYEDCEINRQGLEHEIEKLMWCDTLIFVYPTWWYGLPAMMKGWLDRALLPGVAFHLPTGEGDIIRPALTHIERLGVFTTCGASFWLTRFIGAPGRRTLIRGVGILCAKRCKRVFAAHYLMDSSTPESRAAHLRKVGERMDRLIGPKSLLERARP